MDQIFEHFVRLITLVQITHTFRTKFRSDCSGDNKRNILVRITHAFLTNSIEVKYFGPKYSRFFNHFFTANFFGPKYSRFFSHFFEEKYFGPNYSRFFNHFRWISIDHYCWSKLLTLFGPEFWAFALILVKITHAFWTRFLSIRSDDNFWS